MASLNKLHRHVTSLEFDEVTHGWNITFVDEHGNEHPGTLPYHPRIGMNFYLALQVIVANYCVNNNEEDNLWLPQVALTDMYIDNVSVGGQMHQDYTAIWENGFQYTFLLKDTNIYEVVENLVVGGILYYLDTLSDSQLTPIYKEHQDCPATEPMIRIFSRDESFLDVTLMDNANGEVTQEQINRVWRYIIKAGAIAYGMFNTGIAVFEYDEASFTVSNDLSIPSFKFKRNRFVTPMLIRFDDLTYRLTDKEGKSIVVVNE